MSNYCQGEADGLKETVNIARKEVFFGELRLKGRVRSKDVEGNWGEEVQRKAPQPLWWPS